MKLTDGQKRLMTAAFEGKDSNLPDQWRELICALRDEIREQESKLSGADVALRAYEDVLQQIPPYADGAGLEIVAAWIDKAKSLFETLATIRLAMQSELKPKPKTTRRKKVPVEEKGSEEADQANS